VSAAEALKAARAAGVSIRIDGDDLVLEASASPAPAVLDALSSHKAAIVALLRPASDGWLPEDAANARQWRNQLDARTNEWLLGDRGWEEARRLAWGDLVNEWHELHGQRWPIWQCAGCDAPIGGLAALDLPDGNRVHFDEIECLVAFGKRWRGAACTALVALGLEPPGAANGWHDDG
jgi:hypothetical protein